MTKYGFNLFEETPFYRDHRHRIIERDKGMCQACGKGGHQLCHTRSGDFCCCRHCAKIALGTSFPSPVSLIIYLKRTRRL